jgi:hypothetical protein
VSERVGLHLVGAGATTGVGGTLAVSAAAFRAGLTRTERMHYGPAGDDDGWSHAVRVRGLEPASVEERTLHKRWRHRAACALAASSVIEPSPWLVLPWSIRPEGPGTCCQPEAPREQRRQLNPARCPRATRAAATHTALAPPGT